MKLFTINYACINRSDEFDIIVTKLIDKGFELVDNIEEADHILIYTCGSTEAFINRSCETTNSIHLEHPNKKLIVCGCSTVTAPQLFSNDEYIICSPTDFTALDKYISLIVSKSDVLEVKTTTDVKDTERTAIVVQKGCVRACSYCSIWKAVGGIISKREQEIIETVKKCVEVGKYNLTITGDCISDYGIDIGTNIISLIKNICNVSEKITLNIYDIHPRGFNKYADEFIEISNTGQLNLLGIPIQSGNDRILKLMKRSFDIDKFLSTIKILQSNGVQIITDIIVGFPSETKEDFNDTLSVLKQAKFSKISVNVYTDTMNSESSKMNKKVSKREIIKRYMKLENENIYGLDKDFFDFQFMKLLNSESHANE